MSHELYYKFDNIYMIPSVHGTMEFANIVKNAFFEIDPDCIALELPEQMTSTVLKGVRRLPYLSAVTFPDVKDTYHYIPIHPCDSIIEGARLADEFGKSLYFVDKDIIGISAPPVRPPDSYYITKVGLKNYVNNYTKHLPISEEDSINYLRELHMAHRVRMLSTSFNKVLFVYGLYHHNRIIDFFESGKDLSQDLNDLVDMFELRDPDMFMERSNVELMHLPQESYLEMLGTTPFDMYLYEIGRKGIGSYHMGIDLPPEEKNFRKQREQLNKFIKKAEESAEKICNMRTYEGRADSYDYLHETIFQARKLYNREWDDLAPIGKLSLVLRFARNYALISHQLVPSSFQLITSAKNIVNDDFAWELARLLNFYPFFNNHGNLDEIVSMNNKALMDDSEYDLESHLPTKPWMFGTIPLKKRPKEKKPGDWAKVWNKGGGLVSYPAEDLVIENYFNYLRRKAKKVLEEGFTRSVEFNGSIMDGIDIKETIRNLHLGKIYVKEQIPVRGDVGTIVVIFDGSDSREKYPFEITWYAEHENESDLAFYSTPYDEILVGPGISKAEYGGLLTIFPPQGIYDVWSDPRFNKARSRKERLLMAGIFYSERKYVLYIAEEPPRNYFYSFADRFGKHLMFIPITDLSHDTLNRVRTFHMLSDPKLRSIANRYIRLD